MRVVVKLIPLALGLALVAFALTAGEEGSFANRTVDRGVAAFVDNLTDSAESREAARVNRAERDATAVAEWLTDWRGARYPRRIDDARFEGKGAPGLAAGSHLEEYTRTDSGFRLCVRSVSGAWATWVTGPRRDGLVESGAMGDCSYRSR